MKIKAGVSGGLSESYQMQHVFDPSDRMIRGVR